MLRKIIVRDKRGKTLWYFRKKSGWIARIPLGKIGSRRKRFLLDSVFFTVFKKSLRQAENLLRSKCGKIVKVKHPFESELKTISRG